MSVSSKQNLLCTLPDALFLTYLKSRDLPIASVFAQVGAGETRPMNQNSGEQVYTCPMHRDVRRPVPGTCPKCGMKLVREGTRFAMLQHVANNPKMLAIMAALMLALMIAAMMFMR
jgi:hypothetical protein